MRIVKPENWKLYEIYTLFFVYLLLILSYFVLHDSLVSCFSAFFGITYTFLAGKGLPVCYLFGVSGSGLYGWLAYSNSLWGNLLLYVCYYIPMEIAGYFKWNKNLKKNKQEIVKTKLSGKEAAILFPVVITACVIFIFVLKTFGDSSPVADGITTVLSVFGMYLTVKRCAEQWLIWIIVNGLSAIMWIILAINGTRAYSTVLMWVVYFILAIYFYNEWRKELSKPQM